MTERSNGSSSCCVVVVVDAVRSRGGTGSVAQPLTGAPLELTAAQRKLVAEDPTQTLAQQENIEISGSNARHMVMQKLMRNQTEVRPWEG